MYNVIRMDLIDKFVSHYLRQISRSFFFSLSFITLFGMKGVLPRVSAILI